MAKAKKLKTDGLCPIKNTHEAGASTCNCVPRPELGNEQKFYAKNLSHSY